MNMNNVIVDFPGTAAQDGSSSSQAKKPRGRAPKAGGTVALGGDGSTAATPVKRGRGRPRKNPAASPVVKEASESPAAPVVKRGRGRPRKNPLPPEAGSPDVKNPVVKSPVVKSPVVKSPVVKSPVVKRGRGRPKKNASLPASSNGTVTNGAGSQEKPTGTTADVVTDSNSASTEATPKKRGRGRPKKEDKPRSPTDSPAPKKRRGRPPKAKGENPKKQEVSSSNQPATPEKLQVLFSSAEDNTVMGKLQISFSESESEGPDPMDAQKFNIDALTSIVAPPTSSNPVAPPRDGAGALLEDNKFEESFDED